MTFHYTPADGGGWIAFVADSRALLLQAPVDEALVEGAWKHLDGGAAAILELLTSHGLQATPSFALVEPSEAGTRVIVRGAVTVSVGADAIEGVGAATWIERVVPSEPISVSVHGAASSTVSLPIVRGAVTVALLSSAAPSAAPAIPPPAPAASIAAPPAQTAPSVSEQTITSLPAQEAPESPSAMSNEAAPAAGNEVNADNDADNDYDYLFGATMYRSVSDAAVQTVSDGDEPAEPPAEAHASTDATTEGDHDGATMFVSQLGRPRGRKRAANGEASSPPPPARVVLAVPGGGREVLDEPLLLGRAPSVSGIPSGQLPRLITLTGGGQDISRSHAKVELQGGTVVVTDLHSKNGTSVTLPGQSPMKLRGGEPTPVIVGTVIDIGGVVSVSVEDV